MHGEQSSVYHGITLPRPSESTSFCPVGNGNGSSCDQLDGKTSNEGKSHCQISFDLGIALTRTKSPLPGSSMDHKSVQQKKKMNLKSSSSSYRGESGRLWKTKSTSRQSSSSLFTKKITSSNMLQQCSASRPRGPTDTTRLTPSSHVHERSTRLESRRTVKPDLGVRTRVHGCCHVVATPRVEDKQSIATRSNPASSQARVVVICEDLRLDGSPRTNG